MRGWMIGIAALALAGCEPPTDMIAVAGQAVTQFHQRLDAGDIAAIAKDAEPNQPVSSERAGQMMAVLPIRFGKVVSSKRTSLKDDYGPAGRMVTMTYDTVFADGAGTEEFVYHITGGKAVLSSYALNAATDNVVVDFHKKLEARDFAAIVAMAGPEITASTQNFAALLAEVRDKMGAVTSTKCGKFNARLVDGVRTIELTYETVFENGTESEAFVFHIKPDGTVELGGYYVEPVKTP